jgi:ubiquinone/menaquinone biosynthesis C-methylase UbiE
MSDNKNKNADMKKYVETCREGFWQNISRYETEYLVAHLKNCHDVLSVGCGPAIIEGKLAEYGFNVTGLDVSEEALSCAPDSVRTFVGRAEKMPFAEASFDAVIYVASLQFIDDYRKALQQSFKVLRTEGRIIIMLLNPQSDFFKQRRLEPDSYVNLIRHTDLQVMEDVMRKFFDIKTEYILGVRDEEISDSNSPAEAALYAILGKKRQYVNE